MRIKCIIAYDGTSFMGYQIQDNLRTVENELENAISKINGEYTKVYASGRTDRGVHAKGQVIHFDTDKNIEPYGWIKAINAYLPLDIRVLNVEIKDMNFNARFSAISKEYHYLIETSDYDLFKRNYYAFYKNLDIPLMCEALKKLCGEHNFKGFCSGSIDPKKDFVKTIYEATLIEEGSILRFVFKGSGFLRYQVRRMMGIVIEIGRHRDTLDTIDRVFKELDPKISRLCAPSCGLYLMKVNY